MFFGINKAHAETVTISSTASEGWMLDINAPEGYDLGRVLFASYGTPENYSIGLCHAEGSESIVASYIQGNRLLIGADNGVFGDPCGGTGKWLSVVLELVPSQLQPSEPVQYLLNSPSGLSVLIDSTNQNVTLSWSAPEIINAPVERYAIFWQTQDTNGWAIATGNTGDSTALNTNITIPISTINQDGLDKEYTFFIRADNDSLLICSGWSNTVTLLIPDFTRIAAEQSAIDAQITADQAAADAAIAESQAAEAEAQALIAEQLAAKALADKLAAEKAIADAKAEADRAAYEARLAEEARIIAEQNAKEAEAEKARQEEEARIQAEKDAQAEADRIKAEEEAAIKAEEERILEEQRAKDEADRIAQEEENAKAEAEAKAKAEEDRLAEEERIAQEKQDKEAEADRIKAEEDALIAEEKAKQDLLDDAKELAESGKELTKEEKEAVVSALLEDLKPGESISAEEIKSSGISYADLPPETPIEIRTSESGEVLIITAEVAANVELVQDPGALLEAVFTDPSAALAALGSIGADMTPGEREEATNMVIATVVATGAALNAVGLATGGSAPSAPSGSSGSGTSSGGTRRNEKW